MKGQPGRAPVWHFSLRPTFQPYWQGVGWRLPGASGQARGLRRGFARPWPPRRAAAARSALPPSARRGPRACAGRFCTQQQACQANFWPTAGSRAASAPLPALARPPGVCGRFRGMSSSRGSGLNPCARPGSSSAEAQQVECSLSAAPAWLAGGADRQPDAAGDRAGVGGVQRGRLRPLVARRQLHLCCWRLACRCSWCC